MKQTTTQGPLKPFKSHLELTIQARDEHEAKGKVKSLLATALFPIGVTSQADADVTVYPLIRHSDLRFTVSHVVKIYEGFNSLKTTNREQVKKYILTITWVDGEPDLWICDGPEGVDALLNYYTDHYGKLPDHLDTYTANIENP